MTISKVITIIIINIASFGAHSEEKLLFQSEYNISAIVVSSVCFVGVQSGASYEQNNLIDFGVYNISQSKTFVDPRPFQVVVYEDVINNPGCTAFLAGNKMVSFKFGDMTGKQLDENGVVTYGAGEEVRIAVSATDSKASNTNMITSKNAEILYDVDFASKGKFGFVATVKNLETAKAGSYFGSLSLIITYQ